MGDCSALPTKTNIVCCSTAFQSRVLHLSHYPRTTGLPDGRRLYHFLRRLFYWPFMAVDCYAMTGSWTTCAKNYVQLRRHNRATKMFPGLTPLEFAVTNILSELFETLRRHKHLLFILNRLSKLVRIVPLKAVTAEKAARAFVAF